MLDVKISGLTRLLQGLSNLPSQIRYATAVALTRTGQDVQRRIYTITPTLFTIRGAWFRIGGRFGVRLDPANKGNLQARVYNEAPWMQMQEPGGVKQPRGQHLAIATKNVRRTKREIIRAGQRPKALKDAFKITTKSGDELLLQRKGKGKNEKVTAMYFLHKGAAPIPARWGFEKIGFDEVRRTYESNFERELAKAIATAK